MQTYSVERKEAILKRLRSPFNENQKSLSIKEGIPMGTLYTWRKLDEVAGKMEPKEIFATTMLSAEARFSIIIETALMTELEVSQYCREKGLYPEQIQEWKRLFIAGVEGKLIHNSQDKSQTKKDKKIIQQLEKELNRKEKALAEAAALLILRKKLHAFYEEGNEDD